MDTNPISPADVLAALDQEDHFAVQTALGTVGSLMTREVIAVESPRLVREAMQLFSSKQFRHILVIDAGHLAGVVSDRDVLRALWRNADAGNAAVATIMTGEPITIRSYAPISEAIHLLTSHRINCLPVTTDDGTVEGILTTTDLLRALFAIQRWIESRAPRLQS